MYYIDSNFCVHAEPGPGLEPVEIQEMGGKCRAYAEGYRFVPAGQSWTREDGHTFTGEMIAPWRDYTILAELQALYEEEQAKATEVIAAIVEEVYNSDMEVISNV